MADLLDELTRLLFDSSFMTVASADADAVPWATPVEFTCDEELRFYWTSHHDARHSRNVRANPQVAAAIYDSNQIAGVRADVQGLYVEGTVEELREDEGAAVTPSLRRWLEWRGGRRRAATAGGATQPEAEVSPWRQYRLTPTKLYALDPAGHPDIPGVRVWRLPVDLRGSFQRAYQARLGENRRMVVAASAAWLDPRPLDRRRGQTSRDIARGDPRMPLFMDRHDLPGATPEQVAEAHALDLAPAQRHGVQILSYWFDPDAGSVFCVAKAPIKDDLIAVHREAHGLIPNEIIDVSEDNVLRFLGAIREPADHTEIQSPFRTVMFTDLEGSTSLLEGVGQAAFMVLLTEHDLIIRRALVAARGREVKHTGDGIMASFDDVSDALRAGVAIQDGFDARTGSGATPALRVRIGMAAGEPVQHNDDLFGSTVNLASRICDAAQAGRILVSDVVHDHGLRSGFALREVGDQALKGFSASARIFELLRPGAVQAA